MRSPWDRQNCDEGEGAFQGSGLFGDGGGFHLGGKTSDQNQEIIRSFKELGVKKVAPSHCTGEKAMVQFREAWGENYLQGGAGAVIEVPR